MPGTDGALSVALLRAREMTMRPFRDHLGSHGLTPQQWRVIRSLSEVGPQTSSELSKRCVLLSPSLSRILKALTERGVITRVAHGDGRRKPVRLTRAGEALFRAVSIGADGIHAEIEAAYGRDKVNRLRIMLADLCAVLERIDPDKTRVDASRRDT